MMSGSLTVSFAPPCLQDTTLTREPRGSLHREEDIRLTGSIAVSPPEGGGGESKDRSPGDAGAIPGFGESTGDAPGRSPGGGGLTGGVPSFDEEGAGVAAA